LQLSRRPARCSPRSARERVPALLPVPLFFAVEWASALKYPLPGHILSNQADEAIAAPVRNTRQ
jgi:hypothetical protein